MPREDSVPLQVEKLLERGRMMKTCRPSVLGQLVDQEKVSTSPEKRRKPYWCEPTHSAEVVSTSPEKRRKKLSEPNLIYAFIAVVLEPAR